MADNMEVERGEFVICAARCVSFRLRSALSLIEFFPRHGFGGTTCIQTCAKCMHIFFILWLVWSLSQSFQWETSMSVATMRWVLMVKINWQNCMSLCCCRCHRIGQNQPVLVIRLVTAGTVDETIVQRAQTKRGLERLLLARRSFGMYSDNLLAPSAQVRWRSVKVPMSHFWFRWWMTLLPYDSD